MQLNLLEAYVKRVMGWMKVAFREWSSKPRALQGSS